MWPFFPIHLPRVGTQAPTGYQTEKALREAELRRLRAQDRLTRRERCARWGLVWPWAKRRPPQDQP